MRLVEGGCDLVFPLKVEHGNISRLFVKRPCSSDYSRGHSRFQRHGERPSRDESYFEPNTEN